MWWAAKSVRCGSDIHHGCIADEFSRSCISTIVPPRVWQVIDPSTESLLDEGESADPDVRVTLPEGDGAYRVQIAPANDRARFTFVDAQVTEGRLIAQAPRQTSAAAMSRQRFFRAVPKAFLYPVRSLVRNHKLMTSMVRRDILARYRGSFGGSLWTILNPLLLMATYFFLFGVVLKQKFEGGSYVLYFLAGILPWLAFSEAVGRSPRSCWSIAASSRNWFSRWKFCP